MKQWMIFFFSLLYEIQIDLKEKGTQNIDHNYVMKYIFFARFSCVLEIFNFNILISYAHFHIFQEFSCNTVVICVMQLQAYLNTHSLLCVDLKHWKVQSN